MTKTSPALRRSLLLLGASLLLSPPAYGEWTGVLGGPGAQNRAGGTALITSAAETSPGIAWTIARAPEPLSSADLQDLDGDGVAEVLFVASGRVWALNPQQATPAWVSPAQAIDAIVGFGELDGDTSSPELVASSSGTGGGFLLMDPAQGGVVGSLGPFPTLSGASARETVLADLNGDGIDEIVHPPGRLAVNSLWVSTVTNGVSSPGFLEMPLGGYANTTPALTGDFLGTGDPVIVVDQGPALTLYPTCEPSAPDAVCDDGAGTVCLCSPLGLSGIHATYSFGPRWVLDTDGDGHDELLQLANSAPYIKALGALDFVDGFATIPAQPDATRQWYRRYTATAPTPRLEALSEGPLDLDGDGDLELVVSFYNNDGGDTDATGLVPNDDGIDHPSAVSIGVFDVATGDLEASILDAFAWGVVDLDGDGDVELVTSPTSGFGFGTGLSGSELDCSGPTCVFTEVWTTPSGSMHPLLSAFDGNALPAPRVFTVDTDTDGFGELLSYNGTTLEALTADGAGGVTVAASRLLLPDEILLDDDAVTNSAVVTSATNLTVLNHGLGTTGSPIRIPSRGWRRFQAASFDGGVREAPVFSGNVFMSNEAPSSVNQGDHELYPGFGLAEDLDGDGAAELLTYANPGSLELDDASFEIRLDRWDTSTEAFVEVWELDSEDYAQLTGYGVVSELHVASGDFDGQGSRDIVIELGAGGVFIYAVIDGDTGELDATLTPTQRVATSSGLLVADLVNDDGDPFPDGIDDVLIDGAQLMSLHTIASGELWSVDVGGFIHGVGAYADTDGDGDAELVATLSVTTGNVIEVIDDLDLSTPSTTWGPDALPLPTDQLQVMAIADVDAVAGLDVLYISGDGGVHAYSGATGAVVPGLPVYVADGALTTTPPASAANLLSLMALDVDDDGYEEAIVGSSDGIVYAVNVATDDPDAPGLEWSFAMAAAVRALAAADTDGDGYDEILVSTNDGSGSVIDGIGVSLQITSPGGADCIPSTEFDVTGTSVGVAQVDVFVAGSSISGDVDASAGSWTAPAEAPSTGSFGLVARGKDENGVIVAYDSELISVGEDADEDGWYSCADCDDSDAERNPGAEDICEDGIDQDCDGADATCGDDDDSGDDDDDITSDDDDSSDGDGGGCAGCDGCDTGNGAGGPSVLLLFGVVLALRRRRV
ncbi:MAG: putative metal-binding motif-containing protein [Deltaproteobacteria bacterium]|nr:putative metal-binding motif-containing protein [Deltaproteobacteria bacterium]